MKHSPHHHPLLPTLADAPPHLQLSNILAIMSAYFDTRDLTTSFPWLPPKEKNIEIGFAYPLAENMCVCGGARDQHKKKTSSTGKITRGACSHCSDCQSYQRLVICGRMDLLASPKEFPSELWPVDHKTSRQVNSLFADNYQSDSQFNTYMWAAGIHLGADIRRGYVNAIQTSQLPSDPTRACATHKVPYDECRHLEPHVKFLVIGPLSRTKGQIERWKLDAAAGARRLWLAKNYAQQNESLKLVPAEGTFIKECQWCQFQEFCVRGNRQYSKIESFGLTHSPFDPLSHALGSEYPRRKSDFYIDNSTLQGVHKCSTQSVLRYGLNFSTEKEAWPLVAGIAVHEALEIWNRGGSKKKSLRAIEKVYAEVEMREAA